MFTQQTFPVRESRHFRFERCQQLGVSTQLTDAVLRFGTKTKEFRQDPRGGASKPNRQGRSYYLFFSKDSLAAMQRAGVSKALIEEARKKKDFRWVVAEDCGTLITVMCLYGDNRRIWH